PCLTRKRRGMENGHGQMAWRIAMATQWHLSGDYFENCNCSVVCPSLVSKAPPLTSRPTEGVCDVGVIFHIENGKVWRRVARRPQCGVGDSHSRADGRR